MSANLCWKPVSKERETLPDALKFVLRDKYGVTETPRVFGGNQVPYLKGLEDAGVEGATELLKAIGEHGRVEVWLEY